MKRGVIYQASTGRIMQIVTGSRRSLEATRSSLRDGLSWLDLHAGDDPVGKKVVDGALVAAVADDDTAMRAVRLERARRLKEHVDKFTPLRIEALSKAQVTALKKYRQALLDITKGDPHAPDWPEKPDFI